MSVYRTNGPLVLWLVTVFQVELCVCILLSFSEIPSETVFDMPVVLGGSESRITCFTSGGRPAQGIKFLYNDTFIEFTNTETFDKDTRTYNVSSTFQRTLHRWDNGKVLECCVEHDAINGNITCKSVRLDVKCMYDHFVVYIITCYWIPPDRP